MGEIVIMRRPRQRGAIAAATLGLSVLAGCINTEFGCKGYPEGARCQAVSQVLAQAPEETGGYLSETGARASGTPGGEANGARAAASGAKSGGDAAVIGPAPLELGKPIVRPPQVVRAWLAPWRDSQDRLHEASYVYIMVEPAEWAYTGPTLGVSRRARSGAAIVPRAPADAGREPGAGAGAGRPSPQAAGTAQTGQPKGSAPSTAGSGTAQAQTAAVSAGRTATGTTGTPPVLMVPGAQGMRPVPIPQVGASGGGY
jgi:conjugal transfer pilus assembly protein TraV